MSHLFTFEIGNEHFLVDVDSAGELHNAALDLFGHLVGKGNRMRVAELESGEKFEADATWFEENKDKHPKLGVEQIDANAPRSPYGDSPMAKKKQQRVAADNTELSVNKSSAVPFQGYGSHDVSEKSERPASRKSAPPPRPNSRSCPTTAASASFVVDNDDDDSEAAPSALAPPPSNMFVAPLSKRVLDANGGTPPVQPKKMTMKAAPSPSAADRPNSRPGSSLSQRSGAFADAMSSMDTMDEVRVSSSSGRLTSSSSVRSRKSAPPGGKNAASSAARNLDLVVSPIRHRVPSPTSERPSSSAGNRSVHFNDDCSAGTNTRPSSAASFSADDPPDLLDRSRPVADAPRSRKATRPPPSQMPPHDDLVQRTAVSSVSGRGTKTAKQAISRDIIATPPIVPQQVQRDVIDPDPVVAAQPVYIPPTDFSKLDALLDSDEEEAEKNIQRVRAKKAVRSKAAVESAKDAEITLGDLQKSSLSSGTGAPSVVDLRLLGLSRSANNPLPCETFTLRNADTLQALEFDDDLQELKAAHESMRTASTAVVVVGRWDVDEDVAVQAAPTPITNTAQAPIQEHHKVPVHVDTNVAPTTPPIEHITMGNAQRDDDDVDLLGRYTAAYTNTSVHDETKAARHRDVINATSPQTTRTNNIDEQELASHTASRKQVTSPGAGQYRSTFEELRRMPAADSAAKGPDQVAATPTQITPRDISPIRPSSKKSSPPRSYSSMSGFGGIGSAARSSLADSAPNTLRVFRETTQEVGLISFNSHFPPSSWLLKQQLRAMMGLPGNFELYFSSPLAPQRIKLVADEDVFLAAKHAREAGAMLTVTEYGL